ncbi:hypothetical protein MCUN1_001258 [Malassezia cuniculi]|uniref:37S ribosomal protein S35, mitochondrial n=1 Tax=Malassezia cuniculi TaxID=948313 RepID=A0AAF0EXA2_9BASI|nr:hypothetical protein MCUN1_001258 [Malassezia cuniculi]
MDLCRCVARAARAAGPVRVGVRQYSTGEAGAAGATGGRGGRTRPQRMMRRPLPPFHQWIKGEGARFRDPPRGKGPHWIGATPFPLNPSFKPAPPIAQSLRDNMWTLHTQDPAQWTVRSLSDRFKISIDRTEAILRLKALESEMEQQGKPLQTELQKNMEHLLGTVRSHAADAETAPDSLPHPPRGAPYEESAEGSTTPSALAPALRRVNRQHTEKMKHLALGTPVGSERETLLPASRDGRAPTRIVSVGPSSYTGIGVVARNQLRAKRRKRQREVRRLRAESK